MFAKISTLGGIAWRNLNMGMIILLSQLFLFINITLFFDGADADKYQKLVMIYLMVYGLFFAIPDYRQKMMSASLTGWLPKFLISFLAVFILLSIIGTLFLNKNIGDIALIPKAAGIGIIIYHSIIVAVIEETIFRGILYEKFDTANGYGLFSNTLFALFHVAVYGFNIIRLLILFLLGVTFVLLNRKFGSQAQEVSSGAHAAYNSFLEGLGKILSFAKA